MSVLSEHSVTVSVALLFALLGFAAIWLVSGWRKDASLVDIAWAAGFIVQLVLIAFLTASSGERASILLALIGLWSLRIGWTLVRHRIHEELEDARDTSM